MHFLQEYVQQLAISLGELDNSLPNVQSPALETIKRLTHELVSSTNIPAVGKLELLACGPKEEATYPVLSCPVLSCPVLSCPVLSCPILSYKQEATCLSLTLIKHAFDPSFAWEDDYENRSFVPVRAIVQTMILLRVSICSPLVSRSFAATRMEEPQMVPEEDPDAIWRSIVVGPSLINLAMKVEIEPFPYQLNR